MNGKLLVIAILLCAVIAGFGLYYLQIYGFYFTPGSRPGQDVTLVPLGATEAEPIAYSAFQAIDADSSPIRYRACFETATDAMALTARYQQIAAAVPRNAPGWFDCFDAAAIATRISAGQARVFLGQKNVHFGVDRIVAISDDGQGFIWHELNDCGAKAYDGTVVGEECPDRPDDPQK